MPGMEMVRSTVGKAHLAMRWMFGPEKPLPKPALALKQFSLSKGRRKIFSDAKRKLEHYSSGFITDGKMLGILSPTAEYNSVIHVYHEMHAALLIFLGLKRLKKMRILEIGPNFGPYMYYLKHVHGLHVTGIEISKGCVTFAGNNGLDMIHGDARRMPFKNGLFDLVIARSLKNPFVLIPPALMDILAPCSKKYPSSTDIEFEDAINKEVHRVLKKGGYFFSQSDSYDPLSYKELYSSASRIIPPGDTPRAYPILIMQK